MAKGGISGGRVPGKRSVRPTTGKVREALFNILRGNIGNRDFLDLYAGTGAVGIEALNQGASRVVFVEASARQSGNIAGLIKKHGFSDRATVVTKKALSYIEWADRQCLEFDIVFVDPPYHTEEVVNILSAIGKSHILKQNGVIVAEHYKKRVLPERIQGLQMIRDYRYGDSVLTLYRTES